LSIPENFEDISIYIWDDKLKPYKVPFSEWAKGVEVGSVEWWDKVPIVASTLDGKQVFWVHDTDWYNEETIANGNATIIKEGKENVRAIRNLVKEKGNVPIIITEKSGGHFSTFPDDETKTLIEANPEAQILAVKQNNVVSKHYEKLKGDLSFGIYDIRLGVNKGEYVAFGYVNPKLSDKIVDSIINVLRAYVYKDEALREEFKALTKLDLFNISDIQEYFSLFIHFEKFQQTSMPLVLEELKRFEKGTFVLGVKGNDIVASQIGVAPDEHSYLLFKPGNKEVSTETKIEFELSRLALLLKTLVFRPNVDHVFSQTPVFGIGNDKKISLWYKTYEQFLLNTLETSKEAFLHNGKYITFLQPNIYYKPLDEDVKAIEKGINPKPIDGNDSAYVKAEVIQPEKVEDTNESTIEVVNEEKSVEKKAPITETKEDDKTVAEEKGTKENPLTGIPNVNYNGRKRPFLMGHTTFGSIVQGQRTASTIRKDRPYFNDFKQAKVGDIVLFTSGKGKGVLVKITKPLTKLSPHISPKEWSLKDGHSQVFFKEKVLPHIDKLWRFEFELIKGEPVFEIEDVQQKVKTEETVSVEKSIEPAETIVKPDVTVETNIDTKTLSVEEAEKEHFNNMAMQGVKSIDILSLDSPFTRANAPTTQQKPLSVEKQEVETQEAIVPETKEVAPEIKDENGKVTPSVPETEKDGEKKDDNIKKEEATTTKEEVVAIKQKRHTKEYINEHFTDAQALNDNSISEIQQSNFRVNEAVHIALSTGQEIDETSLSEEEFLKAQEVIQEFKENGEPEAILRLLHGIKRGDDYISYKTMKGIILHTKKNAVTIDEMIIEFKKYKDLKVLVERLNKAIKNKDKEDLNTFLYVFSDKHLYPTRVVDSDGTLKVVDVDYTSDVNVIKKNWIKNFNRLYLDDTEEARGRMDRLRNYLNAEREKHEWSEKISKTHSEKIENGSYLFYGDKTNVRKRYRFLKKLGIDVELDAIYFYENSVRNHQDEMSYKEGYKMLNATKFIAESILESGTLVGKDGASGTLTRLAEFEVEVSGGNYATTFKDNGKNENLYRETTFLNDAVTKLQKGKIDSFLNNGFSKYSVWVRSINHKNKPFKLKLINSASDGLVTHKKNKDGKSVKKEIELEEFSLEDLERFKVAHFERDGQQFNIDGETDPKKFKLGERLFSYRTFMFPTTSDKEGIPLIKTMTFDGGNLTKTLYEQLVLPEVERILSSFTSDVSGYKEAKNMFYIVPALNMIEIDGVPIIKLMVTNPVDYNLEWFNKNYKERSYELINEMVDKEVRETKERWKKYNISPKSFTAYEYVTNYYIFNVNVMMTISGSLPAYVNGKMLMKHFINGDVAYPKNKKEPYKEFIFDVGVNLGKRLAMYATPGKRLFTEGTYFQVPIEDYIAPSENIDYLVRLRYPENTLSVNKLTNEEIAENFPLVADYLYINSADAQEYITLKRYNEILITQGKDPKTTPIKPLKMVYTYFRVVEGVSIPTYVKSSSMPLAEEFTKGLELDKLRLFMEQAEETQGKAIHISFQSANKVGSTTNAVQAFDENGNFIADHDKLLDNAFELDANGLRMQVASKTDDLKHEVTLGSQAFRFMLSSGVMALDGFKYGTERKSGKEIAELYEQAIKGIVDYQYEKIINDKKFVENTLETDVLPYLKNNLSLILYSAIFDRIIQPKINGGIFTLASEAGIKGWSKEVVYTKNYKGQLKGYDEQGGMQILIPSRFKDKDGNLIDLRDEKYSEIIDGKRMLKKGVMNLSFLKGFGFRIPTSGFMSTVSLEIAGFLPPHFDDVIAHKSIVAQMGSDYDIDKLVVYQYNQDVSEKTGKLTLSTRNINKFINRFIRVNMSILNHPEMQKRVNRALSMKDSVDSVKVISSFEDTNLASGNHFSEKRDKGRIGKKAIGVYSHALNYQSAFEISGGFVVNMFNLYDSGVLSKGLYFGEDIFLTDNLGVKDTLTGIPIIDVLGEKQNTATDNEKEQILSRANINSETIGVDVMLTWMRGHDVTIQLENGEEAKVLLSHLLLSQPIIKQKYGGVVYEEKLRGKLHRVEVIEYDKRKWDVFKKTEDGVEFINSKAIKGQLLSPQVLYDNLRDPKAEIQIEVLFTFEVLDKMYKSVGEKLKSLNLNKSNTRDSFEKINDLSKQYNTEDERLSKLYSLPTSLPNKIAIELAMEYSKDIDLLAKEDIQSIINELKKYTHFKKDKDGDDAKVRNAFHAYVYANSNEVTIEVDKYGKPLNVSDLKYDEELTEKYMEELFINTDETLSLPTYLSELNDKRFYFLQVEVSEKEDDVDVINFTDPYHEGNKYFTKIMEELLSSDKALPLRRNKNEQYTNKQLAKDIITYSILTGRFRQIIPDSYWNNIRLGHFTNFENGFLMKKHEALGLNLFTLFFLKNNGLEINEDFLGIKTAELIEQQTEEIKKKQESEIERIINHKTDKDEEEFKDYMKTYGTIDNVKKVVEIRVKEEFREMNKNKLKELINKHLKKEKYPIYKKEELCRAVL